MRRLALDVGEVRVGVAISDPDARVATPLSVLDAKGLRADPRPLLRLLDDYEVAEVVVGLPLSMDGSEGPQAEMVRGFVASVLDRAEVPVTFWDERLTSSEAERLMRSAGADGRARRGSVDKVAASLILQGYLDHARLDGGDDG